jgi:hypothetical protein
MTSYAGLLATGSCQVNGECEYPACFQARIEATADHRRIRRCASACPHHLGHLVQALTAWARDSKLTDGQLTVLAVDPATERRRYEFGGAAEAVGPSFAFSTIPIPL